MTLDERLFLTSSKAASLRTSQSGSSSSCSQWLSGLIALRSISARLELSRIIGGVGVVGRASGSGSPLAARTVDVDDVGVDVTFATEIHTRQQSTAATGTTGGLCRSLRSLTLSRRTRQLLCHGKVLSSKSAPTRLNSLMSSSLWEVFRDIEVFSTEDAVFASARRIQRGRDHDCVQFVDTDRVARFPAAGIVDSVTLIGVVRFPFSRFFSFVGDLR